MLAGIPGEANATDDRALHDERETSLDRHRSFESQDAQTNSASR